MGCFLVLLAVWLWAGSACSRQPPELASFEESLVHVTLWLEKDAQGQAYLAAKFTPTQAGYHLYSKDIPTDGVDGLGRPTRIALTGASTLQPAGALRCDQTPLREALRADLPELRVYPAGPVTLRLPVTLPAGKTSWNDEAAITYMACKGNTCKKPVVNRVIPLQIDIEKQAPSR